MKRLVTNPMILKELQQRLRERRAWLLPTLYLLVLAGTVSFAYYASTDPVMAGGPREVQGADIGMAIFLTVIFTQIVVLLLMAPGLQRCLADDRKRAANSCRIAHQPAHRSANLVGEVCCSAALSSSVALQRLAFAGNLFCIRRVEPMELLKATGSTILGSSEYLRYRPLVLRDLPPQRSFHGRMLRNRPGVIRRDRGSLRYSGLALAEQRILGERRRPARLHSSSALLTHSILCSLCWTLERLESSRILFRPGFCLPLWVAWLRRSRCGAFSALASSCNPQNLGCSWETWVALTS